MLTHTFIQSWRGGGALNKSVDIQAGAELNLDESIPATTNDRLTAFAIDVSQLKGLYIVSDKDVLIETNSSSAPANVFTLAANVPFVWFTGGAALRDTAGTAVGTDITALYITNAGDAAALVQIRALFDPTV